MFSHRNLYFEELPKLLLLLFCDEPIKLYGYFFPYIHGYEYGIKFQVYIPLTMCVITINYISYPYSTSKLCSDKKTQPHKHCY